MKNKLKIDKCHALYSKSCEKEIKKLISAHYGEDKLEDIWTKVQLQFVDFLKDWRTDLGGKKNFHNSTGGTYDCIAVLSYYVACKEVTTFREIEKLMEDITLPTFGKVKFVNMNKMFWKRLMYKAFCSAKCRCDKWHDYQMEVAPFDKDKPIYYEFTACPVAEFIKKYSLQEIAPALCNVDYPALQLMGAKLVRTSTCVNGTKCDYTICASSDEYLKAHPEFVDDCGWRRNK